MKFHNLKWLPFVLGVLVCPLSGQTGAHRIGQVIIKGNGVAANVVPYAAIKVCVTGTNCSSISPVYSDQSLTHVLPQPLSADASGNYGYYTAAGCIDELISAPGSPTLLLSDVCPSTGVVGTGSVTTVSVATANGFQGTVTNPTSAPAISISVDGTHYLPTQSDASNWNGKQAALGFTPENAANKDAASGYAGLTAGVLLKTSEFPAFTGDATSIAGATALTLATVNSSPGSCGDATHVCAVTTNAKGLVTSQTSTTINSVSSLSVGNLDPLFTASVANPTTTPAITFTQSVVPINSVFAGAPSGSAAAPTFQTAPTFSAANLTNFPTLNQDTTGNAATATLATTATTATTASSAPFSGISAATNTHALVIGTGGSLATSGTGTIAATAIGGVTVTGTPSVGQVPVATSGTAAVWGARFLSGVSGTITNVALSASCEHVDTTVTGAVQGKPVAVSAVDGSTFFPYTVYGYVTATNNVRVEVCGTGTPTFTTFNFAVLQ